METQEQNHQPNKNTDQANDKPKVKENKYTPQEKEFADGEGTKLDNAIDNDEANPSTRGE